MTDLIETYGNRVIEGIDKADIYDAFQGKSAIFYYDGKILTHIPSGRKIVLECMQQYFEPPKEYYHLTKKDNCEFIKHALGVEWANSCSQCFMACIKRDLTIKRGTKRY